jgi:hypothetical protein
VEQTIKSILFLQISVADFLLFGEYLEKLKVYCAQKKRELIVDNLGFLNAVLKQRFLLGENLFFNAPKNNPKLSNFAVVK